MKRLFHIGCAIALPVAVAAHGTANPWFGTWSLRLSSPGEAPETLVYSDAGDGAIRMVSVEANSVIVTRMDGRPAPDIGPAGTGEPALAVRAISATRYRWTFFRGVNTLSADRRSFTEVSWRVTDPGRTVTLIYDRR